MSNREDSSSLISSAWPIRTRWEILITVIEGNRLPSDATVTYRLIPSSECWSTWRIWRVRRRERPMLICSGGPFRWGVRKGERVKLMKINRMSTWGGGEAGLWLVGIFWEAKAEGIEKRGDQPTWISGESRYSRAQKMTLFSGCLVIRLSSWSIIRTKRI